MGGIVKSFRYNDSGIEGIKSDDNVWFRGKDVAMALEYDRGPVVQKTISLRWLDTLSK